MFYNTPITYSPPLILLRKLLVSSSGMVARWAFSSTHRSTAPNPVAFSSNFFAQKSRKATGKLPSHAEIYGKVLSII